ncbi:ABC transporter ATP-binding protein [Chitinophaga rhizophila]|uniref:ABC transporter ATP-binding protein/permease n=1 Tax=Chitinophaga rhizophila TaxID=2866212 RepID=A0ABS7GEB2_9BACT|nr:ABC transporter ATP-binding protein [Chitinophaga rhizophila]MBW8686002.1 ABC transporter ATP-binding protein/permease [Chitinophaga rhizophila]
MDSRKLIWKRFFVFLRPYMKYEALLLLLMILGNAAALASPYFLKIIIDHVLVEKQLQLLLGILAVILATYILRVLLGVAAEYLYSWISNQVLNTLSLKLFNHVIRLPMSFFKERSLGDLIHRMNNEVNNVRNALTGTLINFINNGITIIGLIVIMCVLEIRLFLAICLIYPLLFITIRRFHPQIKAITSKIRTKESEILGHLTERVSNIRFIKLFNTYLYEGGVLKDQFSFLVKLNMNGALVRSTSKGISIFLLAMVPLVTLGLGGWQVIKGAMTIGTLIAFLQYANKLYEPFQNIVSLYAELINTSVSLSRIFELLDHPLQFSDGSYVRLEEKINSITLNNVSFSHQDKAVISNLDFTFEAGRHYAIVGASGSGKSTIVDLLCKFNVPATGNILVNGRDLQSIDMESWMQKLTVNSQGYFLFNDTIIENIRYGQPASTPQEAVEAAKAVRLFSDNADYSTRTQSMIGDNGVKLSGGQKQKLSLGRTLLRKTELLIIDEATSETDSKSEDAIYGHLFDSGAFHTIIIISHRLSALKHVQEIIVIDAGNIVEHGTMSDLISRRGHFLRLFESQLQLAGTAAF